LGVQVAQLPRQVYSNHLRFARCKAIGQDGPVVLEQVIAQVTVGQEKGYEEAFAGVAGLITSSPGCLGLRFYRCVETPGRYVVLIEWERLEDHLERFRKSPAFEQYRGVVNDFMSVPPTVEHFELVMEHGRADA
jgi:heme-degrading monooxygenase HmoA